LSPQKEEISCQILTGMKVLDQISDLEFIEEWDMLHKNCPWVTVYQSSGFVSNWYRIYQKKYLPILLVARDGGKIVGLLSLCQIKNKAILGAGLYQAEYQTWISTE